MGLWEERGHKGEASTKGISAIIRRDMRELICYMSTQQEGIYLQTRNQINWYLDLGSSDSRTVRNKCCLSCAVCGILLQQPELTKIVCLLSAFNGCCSPGQHTSCTSTSISEFASGEITLCVSAESQPAIGSVQPGSSSAHVADLNL